jgi:flagellar biogenesis protein FliO
MRAAIFVLLIPTLAHAAPEPLEVIDRGDAVEIVAHNVKATHTTINPVRSRLEVPVAAIANASLVPKDATVKEIEFENQSLSVKLNYERNDVKTLAKYAQATQVGDDLHIVVPRKVPVEGEVVKLPEPTLPPALAAKIADAPKLEPKPEPKVEAKVEPAKPVEQKPAAATTKKAIPTVTEDDAMSKLSMYAAAGLAAIGLGVWFLKKKKGMAQPTSTIDVIAQRSLGGKAKVMWIAAGSREMVVAVTPQSVRMLGQWKRAAAGSSEMSIVAPGPLPEAQTMDRTPSGRLAYPRAATSPAVSGLLRLRAQTQPVVSQDVATDDVEADAQWAKDLLAATGGRR